MKGMESGNIDEGKLTLVVRLVPQCCIHRPYYESQCFDKILKIQN